MTGAELSIVDEAPASGPSVLVGQAAAGDVAARLKVEIPSGLTYEFDEEGYIVVCEGDTLILAGNETEPYQGTYCAVYEFLESLGCRWYFPGEFGEVVPSLGPITVPDQRRTVRPDLRVRDAWYSGHLSQTSQQSQEFATWKRRNRMCRYGFWLNGRMDEARFLQNPVDDSTYKLMPKEKYWESHPEYFALGPGGARNDRFLCMSNPGALQAAADTIVEHFETHPDHHAFAFSPPDAPVLCHCPDCTRAMSGGGFDGEGNGDVSDPYFRFVFALADKVGERLPDRWLTTMAYYNRCRPPQGIEKKHPNVLLQLASIQQCSVHSYAQDRCWSRRQYGQMLRQWSDLTEGQVFYEYAPHDWSHLQRPAWRSSGIADDYRLLKRLGGWGYSNEGQMAWMSTGLNYYTRAQLAWDVKTDPKALVKDFCERFFGPAEHPMHRYYTTVEDALRETNTHALSGPPDDIFAILPRAMLDKCAGWLDEAGALANEEPYRARVAAFRVHFDRLDAYERARGGMARADYADAALWADRMTEAVDLMGDTALLQDAGPWGGKLSGAGVGGFARELIPWVDGTKGTLLAALPADAGFRADPAGDGVVGRWYRSGAGGDWRRISMTSAWYNQGVVTPQGRHYVGVGWYRVSVKLTGAPQGAVRVLFPEFKGSGVWVWCNEAYAGYAAAGAETPLTVDLSGLLERGGNRIVFRVRGEGGLSLPPFLFAPANEGDFLDNRTELRVLPASWLFRTDPEAEGEQNGWHLPDADEGDWRAIPVPAEWGETWVGDYDGDAWYRTRFTIPESAEGGRLVLRFDAVDEEAWVYLNGRLIGESTEASTGKTVHQIWDQPFDVELTDAQTGVEHVLAVRVRDSLMAGGIYKAVRLYELP